MQQKNRTPEPVAEQTAANNYLHGRRNFLAKLTGAAALTAFVAACNKEGFNGNGANLLSTNNQRLAAGEAISMGDGDIAVLNYAYLLEQLEANVLYHCSKQLPKWFEQLQQNAVYANQGS